MELQEGQVSLNVPACEEIFGSHWDKYPSRACLFTVSKGVREKETQNEGQPILISDVSLGL